jgi:hypothetical protein
MRIGVLSRSFWPAVIGACSIATFLGGCGSRSELVGEGWDLAGGAFGEEGGAGGRDAGAGGAGGASGRDAGAGGAGGTGGRDAGAGGARDAAAERAQDAADARAEADAQEPMPPLVGYWPFDEATGSRAFDRSGNGNHGTVVGAAWTGGVLGSALRFDGSSTYVDIPCNAALDFGTGDFSVAAWILTTADTEVPGDTGRDEILAKGDPYNSGFSLSVTHSRIASYVGSTGRAGFSWTSIVVNDGVWHHVAMTRSSGLVTIYSDAVRAHQYAAPDDVDVSTDLIIGRHGTSQQTYFDGSIDEVRIYRGALTDAQLARLAKR